MAPTCRANIHDMLATDTNVCRLGGVANRHICDANATASAASGADRSITEPEELGAGWQILTAFANDADATACTASRADSSMIEPEEHTGWPMHTGFAGDVDATTCTTSGADRSMSELEERVG